MAVAIDGDPSALSAAGLKQLGDIHGAIGLVLQNAEPVDGPMRWWPMLQLAGFITCFRASI